MWSDVRAAFKVAPAIRTAANKIAQVMLGNIFKWKFNEIFLEEATALIEMMSMMPNSISRGRLENPNCHTIPSARNLVM